MLLKLYYSIVPTLFCHAERSEASVVNSRPFKTVEHVDN
jgi:hypothetical protein